MNEVLPKITLSIFLVVQDHDESTGKEEYVKIKKDDESIGEEEDYSTLGRLPPPF
jgi:hypothetical protein